jgi:putative oxidoreductase
MAKTISIYAAQIMLGVIAIAAGYAKLTGAGLMVEQFHAIGLGQGFLTIAGTAEIAAGLCLLMPRGGILGALLLTSVMVGALGVTLGHVASAGAAPTLSFTATSYQAGHHDAGAIGIFRQRAEWDI